METGNYVAQLHEYALKKRLKVDYEDLGSVGPDHDKTFTQRAVLNDTFYPDGVGRNKKEAKHNAAKNALKCLLENEHQDSVDSAKNAPEASSASNINYISWLNEYGMKNRVTIKAVESTRPGQFNATQCCSFMVGDKEYPAAYGKTKREAKEEAAKLVYHDIHEIICGSKTTETGEEKYSIAALSQPEQELKQNVSDICAKTENLSMKTTDEGFTDANFVGLVNHYCQKTKRSHDYVLVNKCGPSHNTQFFYKLVINDKDYPVGGGKTIKEAKQNAARLAWSALQEQSDWNSKTADEKYNCTATEQQEERNPNVSDIWDKIRHLSVKSHLYRDKRRQTETNYIGIVNHYCQKKKLCHSYIEERRCGSPANPIFFYKLMIDRKEYPEGEGMTVKEARQNAARLAWSALQEQSDWDSKVSVRSTVSEDGAPPTLPAQSASLESHDSSSQCTPMSTSDSIIFTDSSNPSKAQMPFSAAGSEDDAPTRLSTPTSLDSLVSSQGMSTGTSGSGIFTDSSNSSKDQDAVKDRNMGNSQNETWNQSRFTSDFDPLDCLGKGAFGCVYKARHKLLDRFYAVKIVCREEKSLREVGTLSDLHHPNIVRYYTFWMEDSGYKWDISTGGSSSSRSIDNSSAKYLYIQMELCDTKTLKEWIDEKNTQSPQDCKRREESLSIAQQIISGVEYIHSKKHIHRDLKPDNILFGLDGDVKIGDFGLVTREDDDDSALMERTGYRGTATYMAPEQKREKTYDRRVDIYPLGLIYFELLWKISTGHERGEIWDNARSQKLPEQFSLTFPQEDQIIKSMLCEKPEDRPEASTLKAELEKWAQMVNAQNMHQKNLTL